MVTKPKTKKAQEEPVEVIGTPGTVSEYDNPPLIEPLQAGQIVDIKHVIRTLSWRDAFEDEGAQPSNIIEDYLNQNYFSQGYSLYKVEHVQVVSKENMPFASIMLYVLVKYAQ